jgi:hypothetical protein
MNKNIVKINRIVRNYVVDRKKKNADISCRKLALETGHKFKINISKSSISSIVKQARLSSPVGRSVSRVFRPDASSEGAGYVFLYGASLMLGLSKVLASVAKIAHPLAHLKTESLEAISTAWLMAKAIYNVPLEKIEDYHKNEMWLVVGRKAGKGLLKSYAESFKSLQPINQQIVSELSRSLQDVLYVKFYLADGSSYMMDGQGKSIWKDTVIPIDFCTTLDIASCYINSIFFQQAPIVVFNAHPQRALGDEFSRFIFSIVGESLQGRIRRIEFIGPKANVIKEIPFIARERRKFAIGLWPWQYKAISDLEKKKASGKFFFEPIKTEYYVVEDTAKFTQHAQNNDVILRLILLKASQEGPATCAILTNFDAETWDTQSVVAHYLKYWPDPETGHRNFLNSSKNPVYAEQFLTAEKISHVAKKINTAGDLDSLFSILVEICSEFAKRCFFPQECADWSLLKMREVFFKKPGRIKMDMSGHILYNILKSNDLRQNNQLDHACAKFNESAIFDYSARKIWALSRA